MPVEPCDGGGRRRGQLLPLGIVGHLDEHLRRGPSLDSRPTRSRRSRRPWLLIGLFALLGAPPPWRWP
ncbi:hypothetical protein J2847_005759 [Azospirillum agricola]|uniref:hypothetical protein n=1 Tax=Azospirillum agricola TaxID=1720247 RepID=UPI001F302EA1|nr:hypothetical protein [Azospirillum agricola]MBP2232430.1 hypothetical protein [Azospirillum agricola]